MLAASVFPYASISLFIFDRQFYQGENASGLYPPSASFVANVLLEMLLNTVNGLVYALICYYMAAYWAFIQPTNPAATVSGYLGIFVAMNTVTNVRACVGVAVGEGEAVTTTTTATRHQHNTPNQHQNLF